MVIRQGNIHHWTDNNLPFDGNWPESTSRKWEIDYNALRQILVTYQRSHACPRSRIEVDWELASQRASRIPLRDKMEPNRALPGIIVFTSIRNGKGTTSHILQSKLAIPSLLTWMSLRRTQTFMMRNILNLRLLWNARHPQKTSNGNREEQEQQDRWKSPPLPTRRNSRDK